MTVKELIEKLKQFDEDRPVFVGTGSVTYEEATYAEESDLCKCSYSNRYHVPMPRQDKKVDVQAVIISLDSYNWLK
jgi:hypothetical protein